MTGKNVRLFRRRKYAFLVLLLLKPTDLLMQVGTTRGLSTKEVAPGKRFYMVSLTDSITAKKKTQAPYS